MVLWEKKSGCRWQSKKNKGEKRDTMVKTASLIRSGSGQVCTAASAARQLQQRRHSSWRAQRRRKLSSWSAAVEAAALMHTSGQVCNARNDPCLFRQSSMATHEKGKEWSLCSAGQWSGSRAHCVSPDKPQVDNFTEDISWQSVVSAWDLAVIIE